jgi:hypothetical protein
MRADAGGLAPAGSGLGKRCCGILPGGASPHQHLQNIFFGDSHSCLYRENI